MDEREPAHTPPRFGRVLLVVASAAAVSLVAMLPGLSMSTQPGALRTVPARESTRRRTTPTTTTLGPATRSAAAAPALPAAAGGFDAGPAPQPSSEPVAPFTWPAAAPTTPPSPRPVEAPSSGLYLGAYVNPLNRDGGGSIEQVLEDLPTFTSQLGRNLAIVSTYQPWSDTWVRNELLTQVADSGAIPMVSWHCGDTDDRVAAGADDALIFDLAYQLRDYGRPVLLRWFWEANLLADRGCLGPGTPLEAADQYRAAFARIVAIFRLAGASNVAFVWCASTAPAAAPMQHFYPGDEWVDWVGADGYDRRVLGADAFTTQFSHWYDLYAGTGKPLIVTETGATTDQVDYLDSLATVVPGTFPQIKALVYFDGIGDIDWRLGSYGGAGLGAFAALGQIPWFATMPEAP